ncbi:four helix bundle protein [Candidatus Parcubacteria bacterium]|nr:four helix bundle protein [Candidatus Parcubacteria bacterium]
MYRYILWLVKFLSALPNATVVREIVGQLMRSGTSVGANYFEAQSASSKREYQNFFRYSLKSANESLFWLAVLRDGGFVAERLQAECAWLLRETKEFANIFAASILTLKGKR